MLTVSCQRFPDGARWRGTSQPRSLPPRGHDPYCCFTFYDDQERVAGYVWLCKTKWEFWETHCELFASFRGQGHGIMMYDTVIQYAKKRGWTVRSSLDYSENAERLWKSRRLRMKHKIIKRDKRFSVESG
jgi:GNAT superfamily N-acetyltransferase